MECHIIRRMRLAHCKRGPEVCEQCREMDQEQICLLDICSPDAGMIQRRVLPVTVDGEEVWREFDIIKVFETEAEAQEYATANGIVHVEL